MKIIILLAIITIAKCENVTEPDFDENPPTAIDLTTTIVTSLLNSETIQNKLSRIGELINLKIKLHQIIKMLLRRDNLILYRHILDFSARVCQFLIGFLPEPDNEPSPSFLESLFPVVTLKNPANPVNQFNEQQMFEKHKDDVMTVAKLIYNSN